MAANGFETSGVPIYPNQTLHLPDGAQSAPGSTAPHPTPTWMKVAPPDQPQPAPQPTAFAYAPTEVPPARLPTYPGGGGGGTCVGEGCYGVISPVTGLPRTQHVDGYTRKDGTQVRGYWRSHR
jgi:hypothetical protein